METMNPALRRIHRAALRLFADKTVGQVNVSELAKAAGVARGTVYNNLTSTDALFEEVASQLQVEMHQRIANSFDGVADPAQRLANGIRFFVRRAHEEPDWGRFLVRFAFGNAVLRSMWNAQPAEDLKLGMEQRRYRLRPDQMTSALTMTAGSTIASMTLVLEGHKTWRDAGSDVAELTLVALGLPPDEARAIATVELPLLAAV